MNVARCPGPGVLGARFRAASQYRLVPIRGLSVRDRERLLAAGSLPRLGGVLTPEGDAPGDVRVVDRDAARLFSILRNPSRLPRSVLRMLKGEAARRVAGLVLDGVLEIEHGDRFLSGVAARSLCFDRSRWPTGRGRVALLSAAALARAASLAGCDSRELARRLYRFNTVPASPEWRRLLPTAESVRAFLRFDQLHNPAAVERQGSPQSPEAWLAWDSHRSRGIPRSAPTYKLYVSPRGEYLPEALRATLDLLGRPSGPLALKVGRDLYGVLRPDKLVAYFRSADDLQDAVRRLVGALDGVRPQGVPFTAAAVASGLLSWGLDPPASHRPPGWAGGVSWRSWLTHRLAAFLVAARSAAAAPVRARRFAMDRASLDGVDPVTWTPTSTVWADATSGAG